jgi:hypothetical protein
MKQQQKTILTCLLIVIYFVAREVYTRIVSFKFAYYGFRVEESFERDVYSFALFIATLFLFFLFKPTPFIYAICYFIVLLSLIPNSIIFIYMDTQIWIIIGIANLILLLLYFGQFPKPIALPILSRELHSKILIFVSFLLIIPNVLAFGFNPNFDIFLLGEEIYRVRLVSRTQENIITGYTSTILANVLLPVNIVIGVERKEKLITLVSVLMMLYIFTCYATKSVFLSIPMLIAYYFGSMYKKLLFTSFTYLFLFSFAFFLDINDPIISFLNAIFYNRLIFVPALGVSMHFNFFQDKPLYLSGSILRDFIDYPYDLPIPFLIGREYFYDDGNAANVGFPADGYINFGVVGIFIFNIMMAAIFLLLNNLKINHKYFGLFVLLVMNLISTYFFTVFFTHGLFVLILLCLFVLKDTSHSPNTAIS